MKTLLSVIIILGTVLFYACSTEPNTPPKFRVQNQRATDVNLQVKTSGGNTININNVKPGTTSAYQEVAKGQVDVTVAIQGESGDFKTSFMAENNKAFTIVVFNTTPPTVGMVSP